MVSIQPVQKIDPPANTVIIHHLSDLHFNTKSGTTGNQALIHYSNYRKKLTKEQSPQIVIFTGDLTDSGSKDDFNPVSFSLRASFSHWNNNFKEHIFLVPGQNDIDWVDGKPSFRLFQEAFKDFGLPTLAGQITDSPYTDPTKTYIAYLLNTCASLDELLKKLPEVMQKKFTDLPKDHKKFLDKFSKSLKEKRDGKTGAPDPKLRKEFLSLVEDTFISLDTGLLLRSDFDHLAKEMHQHITPVASDGSNSPVMEPLKIIVTHHPLIVPIESLLSQDPKAVEYKEVVNKLRALGFHLALHGHLHTPQVLTDISITEGAASVAPLRQFGAGSLGLDNTFNEIVATRSVEKPRWQINVETINVAPTHQRSVFSLAVLDPTESQSRVEEAKRDAEIVEMRTRFHEQLQQVLRLYSESVQHKEGDIPAKPLDLIKSIIQDTIFKDYKVEVGLAIKAVTSDNSGKVTFSLNNRYIDQVNITGALHKFRYLITAASWSLVLGRTLVYPDDFTDQSSLSDDDKHWLEQQERMHLLNTIFAKQVKYIEDEITRHTSGGAVKFQIEELKKQKDRLENLAKAYQDDKLLLKATYQEARDPALRYPFISVPIPLRPSDLAPSELVEVGVINIDILGYKDETKQKEFEEKKNQGQPTIARKLYFTKSRIDMLNMISAVVYLILTEAASRKSPASTWDEPTGMFS